LPVKPEGQYCVINPKVVPGFGLHIYGYESIVIPSGDDALLVLKDFSGELKKRKFQ